MFETQLDEICLFPLQNKKNSFTFDDKKADEVKNFGRAAACGEVPAAQRNGPLRNLRSFFLFAEYAISESEAFLLCFGTKPLWNHLEEVRRLSVALKVLLE